jgi:hypothetical protein
VSEDPLGLGGGINPYVFANNDPINGSDPSGMDAYISFDNNECQYSYNRGSSDLFFDIGGCDFGGGASETDSNPFANDSPWGHSDEPPQGDPTPGATGPTSAKPTPQQVFTAVGTKLTPFNNAMNHGMDCAERSAELAVSSTGDWSFLKAASRIFSLQTITELVTRTLSMGETEVTVSTVSTGRAVVVNSAAAAQAGHIYAVGVAQTRGFNWIHGDNPLLSYVPVVGDLLYGAPAAARACTPGASE